MTPLRKFNLHRDAAKRRGLGFEFTFEEWYDFWQKSGHWEERGRGKGQYVMSRVNDQGPYKVGNVFIQLASQNVVDGTTRSDSLLRRKLNNWHHTDAAKQKMSIAAMGKRKGIKLSDDTRKRMSEAQRLSHANNPRKFSPEACVKMSIAQQSRGPNKIKETV